MPEDFIAFTSEARDDLAYYPAQVRNFALDDLEREIEQELAAQPPALRE